MEKNSYVSITLAATTLENLGVLKDLAEFWKIPYNIHPGSEQVRFLVSSGIPSEDQNTQKSPTIIIPSGNEECRKICRQHGLQLEEKEENVRLPIAPETFTSLKTRVREFQGAQLTPVLATDRITILNKLKGTESYLLSLDIVGEYTNRIREGLEDPVSARFRLVSLLPIPYSVIPEALRNWSLRRAYSTAGENEENGPIECLRTIFLASIVLASKRPIPRIAFWRQGKRFVMTVTHDVESKKGLEQGTESLLEVEKKLDIRSTWNLPSERYPISDESLHRLAVAGDIGAHDTRHDGRLVLDSFDDMVNRVVQCKEKLESSGDTIVVGFRSPLLQHSTKLLAAIRKAGYEFDSSIPSWEALSPTSLKPHGIGTVFPLVVDGMVEIPVSLPQDHQLLRIQTLSPSEAVEQLLSLSRWIRGIGGVCVVLVHPDYEFGNREHQLEYTRLLGEFRKDPECDIMTLKGVADWWRKRRSTFVDISNGSARIRSLGNNLDLGGLDLEIVVGYASSGFETTRIKTSMGDDLRLGLENVTGGQ